jgi:hypothetical protein
MCWYKGKRTSYFYGRNDLEEFLMKFELEVVENKILPVLDVALKSTPAQWWVTHKENINNWYQCNILLCIIFDAEREDRYVEKYDRIGQPREHVERCIIQWILVPP